MSLSTGDRLGPYRILGPAGAGGMGEVYKAHDERLDRTVAVKVLPRALAEREDLRQRFQVEARAIAKVQHAGICSVFDTGEHEGTPFLVMEFLEGETLQARLERGPLPVSEALRVSVECAAGLDAAHRAGITHRDLKPGNVMLTKSGAKLLDFGLAKFAPPRAAEAAVTEAVTLTRALTAEGSIVGTFQYMAPEQLEGGEADARTDIFAFGLILYEMLCGRRAFSGKSQAGLISAILTSDPPPLTEAQPLTPAALDRVVRRCLQKDADDRWQSARDLWRELEWIAGGGSQPGAPAVTAPARTRNYIPWTVAAAALILAALMGWMRWRQTPPEPPPVARFTVALPPGALFRAGPFPSPDGTKLLVWMNEKDSPSSHMYLYTMATGEYRLLPGTANATLGFWSPDSRSIAFYNGGELRRLSLDNNALVTLAKAQPGGMGGAWNEAGDILFLGPARTFKLIRSEGSGERDVPGVESGIGPCCVQWLSDGKRFLFSRLGGGVFLASTEGGPERRIEGLDGPALLGAGHLVSVQNNSVVAHRFDAAGGTVRGRAIPLLSSASYDAPRWAFPARNGVLGIQSTTPAEATRLAWFDRSGKQMATVSEQADYSNPALSPDGRKLAVAIGPQGSRDLWIVDLERGVRTRLTFDPRDETTPAWSPDGRYVFYVSGPQGRRLLFRRLASGTGDEERLLQSQTGFGLESVTSDGRTLILSEFPGSSAPAFLSAFDVTERKLTPYVRAPVAVDKGSISPDGKWVAYRSGESGRDEVFVQPFPANGDKWQISTDGGSQPQWRGDGRELYYMTQRRLMAVDIQPEGRGLRAGIPKQLFEAPVRTGAYRNYYVPASDGRKFLLLIADQAAATQSFGILMNWTGLLPKDAGR